MKKIVIIGAGLCGTLLALRLGQRGYQVDIYERRSDIRNAKLQGGRSINLALSNRGLSALERVGIDQDIKQLCIPMRGRMIHTIEGKEFFSPYSGRSKDYINSVSRGGLNLALLEKADKMDNVHIFFDHKCVKVDLDNAIAHLINEKTGATVEAKGEVVIGTDGAGSAVRKSLMSKTTKLRFNYQQHFLGHGYKELHIPPNEDGSFKIKKEALHIWPRDKFMIIALPNLDGSFTVTMFHPYEGEEGFDNLDTPQKVENFFQKYFPELIPYMPNYVEDFFQNPTGTLGTIRCSPWQANGKVVVMGDAAHAIVPFYGQGMNASFEDVRVFDDLLDKHPDNWQLILEDFQKERIENANAIADLALDNFIEMQDKVNDKTFIQKRNIERQLEQEYPDYYSKYSLVTFQPQLPYSKAMKQGRQQDEILMDICSREQESSLEAILQELKERMSV